MKFSFHTFLLCLGLICLPIQAQVGKQTDTTIEQKDLTAELMGQEPWETGVFPGKWKDISVQAEKTSRELTTLGQLFGAVPQQVQLYYDKGTVQRMEVVYLEAGNFFGYRKSSEQKSRRNANDPELKKLIEKEEKELAVKRPLFAEKFAKLEKDLPGALEAWCKAPGKRVNIGRTRDMRVRGTEFATPDHRFRFVAQDDQLISITIIPSESAQQKLVTRSANRKNETRAQVEKKDNGDVLINNIPMFNQGGRGYCAMGTLAMVMQYYGMNINIDQLAARAGYKDGDTENSKILPIYQSAAKEAHLRYEKVDKFDFKTVQRLINKGRPILVWRWFSRERDEEHSKFKKAFDADQKAELPNPKKDRGEKEKWPNRSSGGHASLVTGYNKERGEVIFSESWGENNRDRRMLGEEMEATAYATFVFEP